MMQRVGRISHLTKTEPFFLHRYKTNTTLHPFCQTQSPIDQESVTNNTQFRIATDTVWSKVIALFTNKWSYSGDDEPNPIKILRRNQVARVTDEILSANGDVEKIEQVLVQKGAPLFRKYGDGSAGVELLAQLKDWPNVALEVFNWRRKQLDYYVPMVTEEYAKAISMAGRSNNLKLAIELFKEASSKNLMDTSLYNSLMISYAHNGQAMKCQSLWKDMKRDAYTPSIVTYNILISALGNLMLTDRMEALVKELKSSRLSPNVKTFNALIAGYITAWMWDDMEQTYFTMKGSKVEPDLQTHCLMLRGYANSGKLEKMEKMYEIVKDHVNREEIQLVRAMICSYCKSSDVNRVQKIEKLLKVIPENEYRSWLNILLIGLYANEYMLDRMEKSIHDAIKHNAAVRTTGMMRCIITNYYHHNAVDKLASFLKLAESAGWKTCRSVYHCKMVMYSSQRRHSEVERVLFEMDRVNMRWSKKTLWILYKDHQKSGQLKKFEKVVGMMLKHGHGIPSDASKLTVRPTVLSS